MEARGAQSMIDYTTTINRDEIKALLNQRMPDLKMSDSLQVEKHVKLTKEEKLSKNLFNSPTKTSTNVSEHNDGLKLIEHQSCAKHLSSFHPSALQSEESVWDPN